MTNLMAWRPLNIMAFTSFTVLLFIITFPICHELFVLNKNDFMATIVDSSLGDVDKQK
jgi:hypothetical protein